LPANTWTFINIAISGDTSSAIASQTNGTGLVVRFALNTGSNFQTSTLNAWQNGNLGSTSSAFNWIGTSGATFYITGVQLEVGTSATGFEYRHIQQEYALCQRYYEAVTYTYLTSTQNFGLPGNWKVEKRATPTIISQISSGSGGVVAAQSYGTSANPLTTGFSLTSYNSALAAAFIVGNAEL
jgi:hypothetical protein